MPTLVPPPTVEPTPTPTAEPTATPTIGPVVLPVAEPTPVARGDLEQTEIPIIGDAVPRIRNTLGGIASTPRRRTTLIVIQGMTCAFAVGVFGYLILRRD